MKHPNFFSVKKMQSGQLKVNDKESDLITPINIKSQSYFQLLQISYKLAECIDIIYNNLNLQLSDIDVKEVYLQDQHIIFCPFEQITQDGQSESKIVQKMIKDIQFYSGINLNIIKKYSTAKSFINSDIFQSGSFSILKDINNTTKIQSSEYISELTQIIKENQIDTITILQHISPIIIQNIKELNLQIEKYLDLLILMVNIALNEDKQIMVKITQQFNQLFTYLCDIFMKKPNLLLNITKITSIKQLPDQSANSFANLSIYILKKQIQSQEYYNLVRYFIKQLDSNIQIFIRYIKIQQLSVILINQIQQNQLQNNQIAIMSYQIILKIIDYNQQYRERTNEDALKIQEINAFQNQQLFQCCIQGIQNGTQCYYLCVQILVLSLKLLGDKQYEVNAGQIGLTIQSIHSVKCLHLGILNIDNEKRQQTQILYNMCINIGLEISKRRELQKQQDIETQEIQDSSSTTQSTIQSQEKSIKQDPIVQQVSQSIEKQWQTDSDDSSSSSSESSSEWNKKEIKQQQQQEIQQENKQSSEQSDSQFSNKKINSNFRRKMNIKKIDQQNEQKQQDTDTSSDDSW